MNRLMANSYSICIPEFQIELQRFTSNNEASNDLLGSNTKKDMAALIVAARSSNQQASGERQATDNSLSPIGARNIG